MHVPVWHDASRQWVKDGKLVLLGVTQEQHPERCRLFAQWKQFDWPILHDPINVLESSAVPIVLALDEHGIVRSTRPSPKTFEAEFLSKSFTDDAKNSPSKPTPTFPPKFGDLRLDALRAKTPQAWKSYGDALALWGEGRLTDTITAYRNATQADPKDGAAWFRLGVSLKRRAETEGRDANDFQAAVVAWGTALDLDPNQYIWRRRIQQYGPRLDKPYPFYDWVPEAEAAIRARGEKPIALPVRPVGAEIAKPSKTFAIQSEKPKNPDPAGKLTRETKSVIVEAVTVPAQVKPGSSVRVHLTLRLAPTTTDHWNNEAEPLRVWVDPPEGVPVSERLVRAEQPRTVTSQEERTVGFEIQLPKTASGTIRIPVFAVYHVCNDDGGQCRFVRTDAVVDVKVKLK